MTIHNAHNQPIDFDAICQQMNDDIVIKMHQDPTIEDGNPQAFLEAYATRHQRRFGGPFRPYTVARK